MKSKHYGEEIVNDSMTCEYCGNKTKTNKLSRWTIMLIVLCVCAVVGGTKGSVPPSSRTASLQCPNINTIPNDKTVMNIHGNVLKLVEKSYYTYTFEDENLQNEAVEGGLFDDASFLACVYSDEHVARVPYQKWFLSQVSDCEIQFDKNGNILLVKSIWDEGGQVDYAYDEHRRVKEMDARNEAENQDGGVVKYQYESNGDLITGETLTIVDDYGKDYCTVSYRYDAMGNLMRAIMKDTRNRDCFFNYNNGKISSILFDDYWGSGVDASFQIEYNGNGDILRITATGKKGNSESARVTTFEYQYDSHNNWIRRTGRIVFADGLEATVRTERTYTYY